MRPVAKLCRLISITQLRNFLKLVRNLSSVEKMITLEYILIKGINDDVKQAKLLAKHAQRLNAKVNLIPYNRVDSLDWEKTRQ